MSIPKISTRATNVELTNERRGLISRKLMPLSRFFVHESDVRIEVVLRKVRMRLSGDIYYLSLRVSTPNDVYMAVANEHQLARALEKARETIRRSVSKGASVANYQLRRSRQNKEGLTLTL